MTKKNIQTIIISCSILIVSTAAATYFTIDKYHNCIKHYNFKTNYDIFNTLVKISDDLEEKSSKEAQVIVAKYEEILREKELQIQDQKEQIQEAEKKLKQRTSSSDNGKYKEFTLSFYTSLPSENMGYTTTAWGQQLKYGMVASNVYPRGTIIYLEGYGEFEVQDKGGSNFNNSNRLDVFIPRLNGESDREYKNRVYNLGIVKVRGYIK